MGVEDRFPVGMRVLAVDDDETCLTVLEKLLRKCQYNVTTTNQAIKALDMLRKNRNKFDLVISDVNMPDMDGFELLELVELEMDLPVIMLSGYGDKERVMRGVIHGACDYLTKPVRIEQLQNIWQHVVRRRIDSKDKNKTASDGKACSMAGKFANEENACYMAGECSQAMASKSNADQNIKLGQKRKEQSEDEEEEEYDQENEEPSNQKKPRLVWNAELHRKFLAAINHLGIDKAFPKRILDLMNVEGLTRENIASHLQKYRLGLKKSTKQPSMVSTLGNSDPYLQMDSIEGFRTLSGSGGMISTTLPSYASGGLFCRLNSPSGLRGINSSLLVQPVQSQNANSRSIKTLGNMQLSMFSANQTSSLLQGIPTSIDANQFQQNNCSIGIRKLSPLDDSSSGFKVSSCFSNSRATFRNPNNSLHGLSNNHLLLQGNSPTHNSGAFGNHSSLGAASVKTQAFDPGICELGYNRHNKIWQGTTQISKLPTNTSAVSNNDQLAQNNLKFSSSTFCSGNSPVDFSSSSAVAPPPLEDARGKLRCQEGLLENILLTSCYTQQQSWEADKRGCNKEMSQTFNTIKSVSPNGDTSSLGHSLDQNTTVSNKRIDVSLVNPPITQSSEDEKFYSMKSIDGCILQSLESQEGLMQNTFESLDDIMNEITKQEQNAIMLMDGEMEFDAYHVGSCI